MKTIPHLIVIACSASALMASTDHRTTKSLADTCRCTAHDGVMDIQCHAPDLTAPDGHVIPAIDFLMQVYPQRQLK